MSPQPDLDRDLVSRLQREVERSVLRARNGIRVVTGASKPRVGVTPKDVVWSRDRAELWRYRGDGPIRYEPPVVFVHSLVSRSYIMDLRPGNSTVEFLLGEGFDVYMLDWGIPDERDADNTIETYVDEYLARAIETVRRESGSEEVTLVGYCLGGTFAILYAAGYEDAPVRNLVLLASPMDYSEMGVMVAAVLDGRLDPEELVDETGNVPRRRPLPRVPDAGADDGDRTARDAARRTSGTTSSSRRGRRWRSGRASRCRSPGRRCVRSSPISCGATC